MLTKKLSSGVERGGESSIVTNPSGGREVKTEDEIHFF
jgi:hypothetical protein